MVEALMREDVARMYAGYPEAQQEALDDLDELLAGSGESVSLHSAERDAAWAEQAGGG
jgi:hypothetical protein